MKHKKLTTAEVLKDRIGPGALKTPSWGAGAKAVPQPTKPAAKTT